MHPRVVLSSNASKQANEFESQQQSVHRIGVPNPARARRLVRELYDLREYRSGAERVIANVSMRHATHRSEEKAKYAARRAGQSAVACMLVPADAGVQLVAGRYRIAFKGEVMAKEGLVEFGGKVSDVLPDNRFRVILENGFEV